MGYAYLNIPKDGTVNMTTILHDVVGLVTGVYTATNQLRSISDSGQPTTSTVINTLGENWSFLYPSTSSFVAGTPNNSQGSWVLQAPCVTTGKTKYIRLCTKSGNQMATTGTTAINIFSSTTSSIWLQICTSATSELNIINSSTFNTNTSTSFQTGMRTPLVLSWSRRHLAMYYTLEGAVSGNALQAVFEFPETAITQSQVDVPVMYVSHSSAAANLFYDANWTVYGPANVAAASFPACTLIPEFFNPNTQTTSTANLYTQLSTTGNVLSSIGFRQAATDTINNLTYDSTGSIKTVFSPLVLNLPSVGHAAMSASKYSNVFLVRPQLATTGDIYRVGTETYAYLNPAASHAFVVKMA